MKKVKAILIDVVKQEVKEVFIEVTSHMDFLESAKDEYLGWRSAEHIGLNDKLGMYVDEEAKLKPKSDLQGWFTLGLQFPIINNALVFSVTPAGYRTDVKTSIADIEKLVQFQDLDDLPRFN